MIHRINVFLLSLIIAFAPVYLISTAYAAWGGPKWQLEILKRDVNKAYLKAKLVNQINNSGTKTTRHAVVETKPTSSKVGSAMIKRIHSPAGVVGVAAVTSLLNGIGWVMEEGTFVKKIPKQSEPCYDLSCVPEPEPYAYQIIGGLSDNRLFSSVAEACSWYDEKDGNAWYGNLTPKGGGAGGGVCFGSNDIPMVDVIALTNPNHDPDKEPELKTVPLTPILLGAAMLGDGYKDPDPNFDNDTVNTGDWTGVEDAYREDPSGIGNELNDSLEDKAERAKPTPDNKPAPIGSPDYDKDLTNDDDANDRSWSEDGNEGKTDSTEKTDPETGEKTTEGSFTLPKFCDWAFTVCEWYEDWQESDQKLHDHLDETASHQSEEKSFWQSVKDWFNWTKSEDELPERDETDLNVETQLPMQNYSVSWNEQCPENQTVNVGLRGIEKEITIINWSFVCSMDYIIKPAVISFASLSGLYIILGTHRRESD